MFGSLLTQGKEKAIQDLLSQSSTKKTAEEEDLISQDSGVESSATENVGTRALLTRANAKFIVRIVLAFTNT